MPVITSKHYLYASVCLFLPSATALADSEEAIARCSKIASVGDRILCLENELRLQTDNTSESEALDAAASTSENPEPVPEPVVDTREPVTKEPEPATEVATATYAADPSESQIEQFGAPEKEAKANEMDSIDVRIVKVSNNPYGKFVYTTDSGQVWLQTDKNTPRYRQVPFQARIRKAAAGSFFMRPQYGGVAIRVKRKN